MKENRNLVILIVLLAFAGIGYLLYSFLFAPMIVKVNEASLHLSQQEERLNSYEVQNAGLDSLKDTLLDKASEVDSENIMFLPDLDTDKITYFINTISIANNIKPAGIYFDEIQKLTVLSEIAVDEGASTITTTPATTVPGGEGNVTERPKEVDILQKVEYDLNVNFMNVEIRLFDVDYARVLAFMKAIEAEERTIYFAEFLVDRSTTNTLNVTLRYNFYAADKVTSEDPGFDAVPEGVTGKADPFV